MSRSSYSGGGDRRRFYRTRGKNWGKPLKVVIQQSEDCDEARIFRALEILLPYEEVMKEVYRVKGLPWPPPSVDTSASDSPKKPQPFLGMPDLVGKKIPGRLVNGKIELTEDLGILEGQELVLSIKIVSGHAKG